MISVQKSHMKYIWQRYLQPTIIDGWRPAPVETVNRTMSAPVPAERHQSRWHFRDRDSAIWQHQGNNCCHTYEHLWGSNTFSCRACDCPLWDDQGGKPWRSCNNIDRVKLKKHQEVTFQESGLWATTAHAHTYYSLFNSSIPFKFDIMYWRSLSVPDTWMFNEHKRY
jgi:hypothetical protein